MAGSQSTAQGHLAPQENPLPRRTSVIIRQELPPCAGFCFPGTAAWLFGRQHHQGSKQRHEAAQPKSRREAKRDASPTLFHPPSTTTQSHPPNSLPSVQTPAPSSQHNPPRKLALTPTPRGPTKPTQATKAAREHHRHEYPTPSYRHGRVLHAPLADLFQHLPHRFRQGKPPHGDYPQLHQPSAPRSHVLAHVQPAHHLQQHATLVGVDAHIRAGHVGRVAGRRSGCAARKNGVGLGVWRAGVDTCAAQTKAPTVQARTSRRAAGPAF